MNPDKARGNEAAVRNDDPDEKATPPTGQPGQEPDGEGLDARDQPEKLKENRERLGVDDEHKTPDMKEHHRGTFP